MFWKKRPISRINFHIGNAFAFSWGSAKPSDDFGTCINYDDEISFDFATRAQGYGIALRKCDGLVPGKEQLVAVVTTNFDAKVIPEFKTSYSGGAAATAEKAIVLKSNISNKLVLTIPEKVRDDLTEIVFLFSPRENNDLEGKILKLKFSTLVLS